MPTNVSPEYKKAEADYKAAREARDRLAALREMLRTIPKHKGTEHLQAGIKTKIKELTEELAAPRKAGARAGPVYTVRPEGAGQIVLLGPPNSGKSSLHHNLTGSGAQVGAYPFTTHHPQPGMAPVGDIGIQLIDLPPITTEHPLPWIGNALQPADGALLVVDVAEPGCVATTEELVGLLEERKVFLTGEWPNGVGSPQDPDDPFAKVLPTAVVASKADLTEQVEEEIEVLMELVGLDLARPQVLGAGWRGKPSGRLALRRLGGGAGVHGLRLRAKGRQALHDPPGPDSAGCGRPDPQGLRPRSQIRPADPAGQPDRRIGKAFPLEDGDRIEIHI